MMDKHGPYILGILVIFIVLFTLSSLRCWLNPRPEFEVVKIPSFPVFWQYNSDSDVELMSAAYFPDYFEIKNTRVNRPGYPILVHLISQPVEYISGMPRLKSAAISYLILKAIVYLSGMILFCVLVYRELFHNELYAFFSTCLLVMTPHSIIFMTTFHTSELQIFIPIYIVSMMACLYHRYSTIKNILFSFIIGYLFLCKPCYGVYLAVLIFAIWNRWYLAAAVSFIVHLIPLYLYLCYLKQIGIEYYSHDFQAYNHLYWLFNELPYYGVIEAQKIILGYTQDYFINLAEYYHVFLLMGFASFTKLNYKVREFLIITMIFHFGQTLATRMFHGYMAADLSFFIYPLSVYSVVSLYDPFKIRPIIYVLVGIIVLYICGLTFINTPWVSPYDQPENTIERIEWIK